MLGPEPVPGKRPCSCLASATRRGWQQHSPCETETRTPPGLRSRAAPRELPSGTALGLLRLTTTQKLPLSTATGTERQQSTRTPRCCKPCHVLLSRGTHPEHPTWLRHHGSLGRDAERGLLAARGSLPGLCRAAKPHNAQSRAPQTHHGATAEQGGGTAVTLNGGRRVPLTTPKLSSSVGAAPARGALPQPPTLGAGGPRAGREAPGRSRRGTRRPLPRTNPALYLGAGSGSSPPPPPPCPGSPQPSRYR